MAGQQGGINAPYTRFRGPILVGHSSDFGIAAVNGGSTAPLISYWNASEIGTYVVSSGEVRGVAATVPIYSMTSGAFRAGTTAVVTTSGNVPYFVLPVATASLSSGALPASADLQGGVAVVYEVGATGNGRLWFYTTVSTGWAGSTGARFTTTST